MRQFLWRVIYGVEEYYIYDPDTNELTGLERREGTLTPIEEMAGWLSPRSGVRFELGSSTLNLYDGQGQLFLSPVELRQRAEQEKARADRLAAKLKALGVDPEAVN
ncbi:MAG: hypothetical protein ACKO21_13000 [Nodosilinea sp.]